MNITMRIAKKVIVEGVKDVAMIATIAGLGTLIFEGTEALKNIKLDNIFKKG